MQAKELVSHLEVVLKPFFKECQISMGLGYVEVGMRNIDKGNTLIQLVERVFQEKDKIDFLFAIGDD
jgi:hypothetical protein